MAKDALRAECLRLRREGRLSLREIHAKTGASKGSLSRWLKDDPLTPEEIRERQSRPFRHQPTPKKSRGEESKYHRMAKNLGEMTRQQKAKVAEAAVMYRMCVWGYNVFGSVFDGDCADWIVEVPSTGQILKVQVKWAQDPSLRGQPGLPRIPLGRSGPAWGSTQRYRKGEFDFIVGYDFFTDTCYVWSWADVVHLGRSVTIVDTAAERWDKLQGRSSV